MTMPAGKYYVGDLCYVMHDVWDEVCDLFFKDRTDHGCNQGEFTLKDGRRFACYNTAFGDGLYPSNCGTTHSVDAGCIGCILVDDVRDPEGTPAAMRSLGAVAEFQEPFATGSDGATIRFGNMEVYTGDYGDEEDEDY